MKTTHLGLNDEERALARMRASQLGLTVTRYVAQLIQRDADEAGLSGYLNANTQNGGRHAR